MITEEMVRAAVQAAYYAKPRNKPLVHLSKFQREMLEAEVRAALSAALAAMWQDHVIAPREPTTVQANAGVACDDLRTGYETVKHIYRHMVAASPYARPTQLSTRMGSEKTAEG